MQFFFSFLGILDVIAIERAGLELVREGRSAVEAEAGRTVNRATIAKLANSHMSMGSVDFGQIAPMVGESELLGTSIYYVITFKVEGGGSKDVHFCFLYLLYTRDRNG